MTTELSKKVRYWLDHFDEDPDSILVYQNGREWVPVGNELPLCFVALVRDRCLRLTVRAALEEAGAEFAPEGSCSRESDFH